MQREQEQSNSQMPVQSSLDDDGGVPYESKVATAMAMQNLQNLEAIAQTEGGFSQHLQVHKPDHERNPSGSSAGETADDPSMLGLSPGQPMTNYHIVEAQQHQLAQQATVTKKIKG